MQKKAIIDVQFNWIFIIIAGAVILLFFISVINKQRIISDNQISSKILLDLESILTGAKVSTGTVNIVDIPKKEIGFQCDKYFISGTSIQIRDKVIFSPDLIKGTELITWALDWNVPFWVTNFLYLTTKEVRYIIVKDPNDTSNLADKIRDDWLPDEITKEIRDYGETIQHTNNYRVKFVYVNIAPNNAHLSDFPNNVVQAIEIDEQNNQVIFWEPKGILNEWQPANDALASNFFDYIGKEPLIGAIFSHDNEMYSCSMKKAYEKLNIIAPIYEERSTELNNFYSSSCKTPHADAIAHLQHITTTSGDLMTDPYKATAQITTAMTELDQLNGVAQLYSCVLIY